MKPGQTLNVVASGVGKSIFWSERVNERIQALASEAEDYAEGIISQLDTVRGGEFHEAYTKKFAELIVRECAEQSMSSIADYSKEIKKHFGVEE